MKFDASELEYDFPPIPMRKPLAWAGKCNDNYQVAVKKKKNPTFIKKKN